MTARVFQQMAQENKWCEDTQRSILLESTLLTKEQNFYEFIQNKTRSVGKVKPKFHIEPDELPLQHLRLYRKLCSRYMTVN